jgi:Putative adhesin
VNAPQPYPTHKQARVQRTPAVALRLLLSVSLLAACVPLLRLTMVSAPGPAQLGIQRLIQQEPLGAARRVSLQLAGDWADVKLGSADLQGNLIQGEIVLPKDARVQRTVTRTADAASAAYTVSAPLLQSGPQPLRFTLNRQGLNLIGTGRMGLVGTWNVKLGQTVPASVSIKTSSGDQALDVSGAALSSLTSTTQSGEVSVRLPRTFTGPLRLSSQSGDLSVERRGNIRSTAIQGILPAGQSETGTIESRSTSGNQLLNLGDSRFLRVRASTQSGDLTVRLPERPGLAAALSTQSGDLKVTVPEALNSGDVNAQTSSGDLSLNVPKNASVRLAASSFLDDLSVPSGYVQEGGGAYLSPSARRGVPALHITLSTKSGSITVNEMTAKGEQP